LSPVEWLIASNLQLILFTIDDDLKFALFRAECSFLVIQLKRQLIAIAFENAVTTSLSERRIASFFKFAVIELPLLKPTHAVCAVTGQLPINAPASLNKSFIGILRSIRRPRKLEQPAQRNKENDDDLSHLVS